MDEKTTKKRKKTGIYILILGLILVCSLVFIYYMLRINQKEKFDKLYSKERYLTVSYGVIEQEKMFQEENALFKKVFQENKYYLIITKDNTLFTYYLDWYYQIDPLKGYKLVYNIKLTDKQVQNILNNVREKALEQNLREEENIAIYIDKKNMYINSNDFQLILQKEDILISI